MEVSKDWAGSLSFSLCGPHSEYCWAKQKSYKKTHAQIPQWRKSTSHNEMPTTQLQELWGCSPVAECVLRMPCIKSELCAPTPEPYKEKVGSTSLPLETRGQQHGGRAPTRF